MSKSTSTGYPRTKTVFALLTLWSWAPLLLLWALAAWLKHLVFGPAFDTKSVKAGGRRLRVLVTGGKMSKASAVSRAVGREGHTVFTAEISPYEYCHTQFGAYVKKHFVLPRPTVNPAKWQAKMQKIVLQEKIDLVIPCTAPVESSAYAHLRKALPSHVRVFAFDGETSDILDNKYTFNQVLVNAGIPCPETANMECLQDAVDFFANKEPKDSYKTRVTSASDTRYIVKPAVYDPKARTEILFLPIEDKDRQLEYLRSRNATKEVPYVIQEVLSAPEYGSFAIYNKGELTAFEFWESCASCLRYVQTGGEQYEKVLDLHKKLGRSMKLTGQLTLDLMHNQSGDLIPIECNPRIHSAICTLEGDRNLGSAYTDPSHGVHEKAQVVTSPANRLRYWVMDQVFLRLGFWKHKSCFKLPASELLTGSDAILHGDDPLPFLAMYLLQIPSLLLMELWAGTPWLKIDFCIGKIVKEGGD